MKHCNISVRILLSVELVYQINTLQHFLMKNYLWGKNYSKQDV